MKNLAYSNPSIDNVGDVNETVLDELNKAGITPIASARVIEGEVPTNFTGKLGDYTFTRAWSYWIFNGRIPLDIAKKIHQNPNCTQDVRVHGNCSCPAPEDDSVAIDETSGKFVISDEEYNSGLTIYKNIPNSLIRFLDKYINEHESTSYKQYITFYHIDTQEGLNAFVHILKNNT